MKPSPNLGKAKKKSGRAPRIIIGAGSVIGYLTVLKRAADQKRGWSWKCRCTAPSGPNGNACNREIVVRQHYMLREKNPKTHCGCLTYIGANPYKREKTIWQMMNRRCLYPTHASYHYYGGAGIRPCDRWIETNPDGFKNFMEDMGPAPTPQHTLERLDPFLGYAPFKADGTRQCVWATMDEQARNKKIHHIQRAAAEAKKAAALAAEAAKTGGGTT